MEEVAIKPSEKMKASLNTPILQKEDYYPSWLEFAAQKFEQINLTNTDGATYTVPSGSILYITASSIAGNGRIFAGAENPEIIRSTTNLSLSFPMPLKILAGTTIRWETSATVFASFYGFLMRF